MSVARLCMIPATAIPEFLRSEAVDSRLRRKRLSVREPTQSDRERTELNRPCQLRRPLLSGTNWTS